MFHWTNGIANTGRSDTTYTTCKIVFVHSGWLLIHRINAFTLRLKSVHVFSRSLNTRENNTMDEAKGESNGTAFLEQSWKTATKVNHKRLLRRLLQFKYFIQKVRFRGSNDRIITRLPLCTSTQINLSCNISLKLQIALCFRAHETTLPQLYYTRLIQKEN
jgi:hypothetical protein